MQAKIKKLARKRWRQHKFHLSKIYATHNADYLDNQSPSFLFNFFYDVEHIHYRCQQGYTLHQIRS